MVAALLMELFPFCLFCVTRSNLLKIADIIYDFKMLPEVQTFNSIFI